MSIRFICTCGKHLKARDEMAARRSLCPGCGRPVGVPSSQPNQRGAPVGPLSPYERRQRARTTPRDVSAPDEAAGGNGRNAARDQVRARQRHDDKMPFDPRDELSDEDAAAAERLRQSDVLSRLVRKDYRRRLRPLETRFYQSLLVPCCTYRWEIFLALTLGIATTLVFLVGWPALADDLDLSILLFLAAVVLVPAIMTCAFLQGVLRSAVVGAPAHVLWSDDSFLQIVWGTIRWLLCLVIGPFVLALIGLWYWIWCGDLDLLNWLILAEISFAAAGSGLFALLAVTRRGRLWDANPVRVAALVRALGPRAMGFAVAAWLLVLVHGWCVLAIAQDLLLMPGGAVGGFALLALSWFGLLFSMTFLLRLLGLWCYRKLGLEVLRDQPKGKDVCYLEERP